MSCLYTRMFTFSSIPADRSRCRRGRLAVPWGQSALFQPPFVVFSGLDRQQPSQHATFVLIPFCFTKTSTDLIESEHPLTESCGRLCTTILRARMNPLRIRSRSCWDRHSGGVCGAGTTSLSSSTHRCSALGVPSLMNARRRRLHRQARPARCRRRQGRSSTEQAASHPRRCPPCMTTVLCPLTSMLPHHSTQPRLNTKSCRYV